jgi:hypothetical protein
LERYHQEVNRRINVVRIFPNREGCLRLVSALAMEQSEDWQTGHRYLPMDLLEGETIPVKITALTASPDLASAGSRNVFTRRWGT